MSGPLSIGAVRVAGDRLDAEFSVPFAFPVVFTRRLFAPDNETLDRELRRDAPPRRPIRAAAIVDASAAGARPELVMDIHAWFAARAPEFELAGGVQLAPGGEGVKRDPTIARDWLRRFLELKLDRQSYVVAVGGGALLDAVGYAAALVHRGLRLIRVPTTVLAQNDAGVGVKNGLDFAGVKNGIGMFAPPWAVINDAAFLDTLPDREWLAGIAEAFKVAMIKDAEFFRRLCAQAPALRARDAAAMERLIRRCAELHLRHIATNGDPFERGTARPLDFGHWSAHWLETASDYRIGHGEAVACGIALDAGYAARRGWLAANAAAALRAALAACGFSLWHPELDRRDAGGRPAVFQGLESFREHLGGELTLTFPDGLGRRREEHTLDLDLAAAALEELSKAPGER